MLIVWLTMYDSLLIISTMTTLSIYSETCVFRTTCEQPKCPDYQSMLIFQVSLHENEYFGTITKCRDYGGIPIVKGPD